MGAVMWWVVAWLVLVGFGFADGPGVDVGTPPERIDVVVDLEEDSAQDVDINLVVNCDGDFMVMAFQGEPIESPEWMVWDYGYGPKLFTCHDGDVYMEPGPG